MTEINGLNGVNTQTTVNSTQQNVKNQEKLEVFANKNKAPENYYELQNTNNGVQKIDVNPAKLDYENFPKNKGFEVAEEALDTVKDALRHFQHQNPGAKVDLEAFPDPADYGKNLGKKSARYAKWETAVKNWRDNACSAIALASDTKVQDSYDRLTGTVVAAYADLKGGQKATIDTLIGLGVMTKESFEELHRAMNGNTNKVIQYVRQAQNNIMTNDNLNNEMLSSQIMNTAITLYNQAERNNAKTREDIKDATEDINTNTKEKAQQTQEINASAERITTVLNNTSKMHSVESANKVTNLMEQVVGRSDIPHTAKMQSLNVLEQLVTKQIIFDKDILKAENQILKIIDANR